MSDEELAQRFTEATYYQARPFLRPSWVDPYGNSYLTKQDAADKWLEWLQQPAED